jgi:hypothetical protein
MSKYRLRQKGANEMSIALDVGGTWCETAMTVEEARAFRDDLDRMLATTARDLTADASLEP